MASRDTVGYASLQQLLQGQANQRAVDQARWQNDVSSDQAAQQATAHELGAIYQTQEQNKLREALARQAAADRAALERSRSADRNLALQVHHEDTQRAQELQKQRAQDSDFDRRLGLFKAWASAPGENGVGFMVPIQDAFHAAFAGYQGPYDLNQLTPQGAGQPPQQPSQRPEQAPQPSGQFPNQPSGQPSGTPSVAPAGGTPTGGAAPFAGIQRNVPGFKSKQQQVDVDTRMRDDVAHYTTGLNLLKDLEAVPDSMFGAGGATKRRILAESAAKGIPIQNEQDKVERRIEQNINSHMLDWLMSRVYKQSGKTVNLQEFQNMARMVGMSSDWTEKASRALVDAAATAVGGATGGAFGAMAGGHLAQAVTGIVGDMSQSILNRPNKREAVQALQDYLENFKTTARNDAASWGVPDPFGGAANTPGYKPLNPESTIPQDKLDRMDAFFKSHGATTTPAKKERSLGEDDRYNIDSED